MQVCFAPVVPVGCGQALTGPLEPRLAVLPKESPAERAERFRRLMDSGQFRSQAELARALGCSQVWVSKVLRRANGNGQSS